MTDNIQIIQEMIFYENIWVLKDFIYLFFNNFWSSVISLDLSRKAVKKYVKFNDSKHYTTSYHWTCPSSIIIHYFLRMFLGAIGQYVLFAADV